MQMPQKISPDMIAPCGMDCTVCYKHCLSQKPCRGCHASDTGKPGHCRSCAIKSCAAGKGVVFCCACGEFPCARILRLDKSYRLRYAASLVENIRYIAQNGIAAFLAYEREKWICPACGGIISLHDRACSSCGKPVNVP